MLKEADMYRKRQMLYHERRLCVIEGKYVCHRGRVCVVEGDFYVLEANMCLEMRVFAYEANMCHKR